MSRRTKDLEKLKEMNGDQLHEQERNLSEQVFRLRFQMATGQTEGLKRLREARKDLARVKTLQRQNEMRKSG
ncbi:MAG: 50S ribosomal protein L29 [Acidobacteria bacterium]|nr:50S ribosomal protein L29 [Acidobacteriota bacterium]